MKRIIVVNLCFIFLFTLPLSASAFNFYQEPVPTAIQKELIAKKLWKDSCPVPLDRLVLLTLSYYDFEGKSHDDGRMIVMDVAGDNVLKIFKTLYKKKFPIKSIKLTSDYGGSDDLSMADNNSSAYNCREITGGGLVSLHAYGLAVDINPIMNPYIGPLNKKTGSIKVLPPEGFAYLNRTNKRTGMTENIVSIFKKNGFTSWGGNWNDPIDWQHFQAPRPLVETLKNMAPQEGKKYFKKIR